MTVLLLAVAAALAGPVTPAAAIPDCQAGQLSLTLETGHGRFDGMMHDGADLVVHNTGPTACRMPGLPVLRFADDQGRPLPIARAAPPGMHPGPAVMPVPIPAGRAATAELRWVSGDAYGGGNCVSPAFLSLATSGPPVATPFPGHLCGPGGQAVTFTQGWFRPGP